MIQGKGRAIATMVLGFSLTAATGTGAYAQHVVTEDEAGKLTLEALTAPPPRPVYHPVYRSFYRSMVRDVEALHFPRWRHRAGARSAPVVQEVAYRHVVRHAATRHAGRRYRS